MELGFWFYGYLNMSVFDRHPQAGHKAFPYYFTEESDGTPIEGFWLTGPGPPPPPTPIYPAKYDYDLAIYYDSLNGNDFLDCRCSRWDVQNYSVIIETWLKKADFQNLVSNTKVGAVGELYNILGKPRYYDKTWQGNNTIRLFPTPSCNKMPNSNLKKMRRETLIFPKNISYSPVKGGSGWIQTKIEGYVSGQGDL